MRPGSPQNVKRPYKGPPVSFKNRWYHINGVKNWLHEHGVRNNEKKFVVAREFCVAHSGASYKGWDGTAQYIQENWEAFVQWFNTPSHG